MFDGSRNTIGILYVSTAIAHFAGMLSETIRSLVFAGSIGTFAVTVLSTILLRRGVKPLQHVSEAVTGLAGGNLETKIGHTRRADEIGATPRGRGVQGRGSPAQATGGG